MSPDSYTGSLGTFIGNPRNIPVGWLPCNGQMLNISNYQMLYSLIGNRYGGSLPAQTFALPSFNPNGQPDAQGRLTLICAMGTYPVAE